MAAILDTMLQLKRFNLDNLFNIRSMDNLIMY